MGQIIIEVPQDGQRTYRIASAELAKKLLANLERMVKKDKIFEDEDILGLWAAPPKPEKKAAV